VAARSAGDRLQCKMSDSFPPEHRSHLSVSLKPRATREADRPLVLGVFSFRHDAHLVPGLIENMSPMVDGWVSYDDRSSDSPFGDERLRRKTLLDAAVAHGAGWILALDPAERIEAALAGCIRDLVRADGLVAYEFRLRSMFSAGQYRADGDWDRIGARRLFSIRPGFLYGRAGFADHWYPSRTPYRILKLDLNIYDFRTATAERRRLLRDTREHLDPFIEHRPFAHEHLVEEAGLVLAPIPADRFYLPPLQDDGGAWSAVPPRRPSLRGPARERFDRSVDRLFNDPRSPLFAKSLPGHERGVDRLNRREFCRVLDETVTLSVAAHGYPPNLFQPERFLEKLVWRKFFANLRVPQSGNKLLVGSYIPPQFEQHVRVPQVVWRSAGSQLPGNGEIAAGWYYLKSNHGSGNVKKIRYPLETAERIGLERATARWLQRPYRPHNFEWWYNVFPREIFLEQSVGDDASSTTWSYPAFVDGIPYVNVNRKTSAGVQAIRLSRELEPLPERYQPRDYERLPDWTVTFDPGLVERIATAIAAPLGFARVDFLFAPGGSCFLNEITLTPNNALAYLHPELDVMLGRMWSKLV
jgi:hypothetical protein